ncbi:MAG: molybdenum cofactor guanylyltransferase MobA [Gammaproteobacteria bacterium]
MSTVATSTSSYPADDITGLILAGGQGSRMGGVDKGLVEAGNRPLVAYVLDSLRLQAGRIVINHARNTDRYARFGCPLVKDREDGFQGPLAGLSSGLSVSETSWVLTAPCDTPGIRRDLGPRLYAALASEQAEIAVAHDGEWLQPLFMLVSRELGPSLERFLADGGRKVDKWFALHRVARVDFNDWGNAFANLNTEEQLRAFASGVRDDAESDEPRSCERIGS